MSNFDKKLKEFTDATRIWSIVIIVTMYIAFMIGVLIACAAKAYSVGRWIFG